MDALSSSVPALSYREVDCSYEPRAGVQARYPVLRGVNLTLRPREFLAVIGPTGCGKSTLLHLAAGLLAQDAGEIQSFGLAVEGLNRRAGYMFQAESLMPWRTALGNVLAGLQFRGVGRAESEGRARTLLERVGLAEFLHHHPHQLSGGMRKRVALAQTLVLEPDLLLMDEPFSALDAQTRELMQNQLLALRRAQPCAALLVTHDLDEAIALGDRIVILSAGPGSHPIGDFAVERPPLNDVSEAREMPALIELSRALRALLRREVLLGYPAP
jgi:NitT/TauT family transport system ATP-binding protein